MAGQVDSGHPAGHAPFQVHLAARSLYIFSFLSRASRAGVASHVQQQRAIAFGHQEVEQDLALGRQAGLCTSRLPGANAPHHVIGDQALQEILVLLAPEMARTARSSRKAGSIPFRLAPHRAFPSQGCQGHGGWANCLAHEGKFRPAGPGRGGCNPQWHRSRRCRGHWRTHRGYRRLKRMPRRPRSFEAKGLHVLPGRDGHPGAFSRAGQCSQGRPGQRAAWPPSWAASHPCSKCPTRCRPPPTRAAIARQAGPCRQEPHALRPCLLRRAPRRRISPCPRRALRSHARRLRHQGVSGFLHRHPAAGSTSPKISSPCSRPAGAGWRFIPKTKTA